MTTLADPASPAYCLALRAHWAAQMRVAWPHRHTEHGRSWARTVLAALRHWDGRCRTRLDARA